MQESSSPHFNSCSSSSSGQSVLREISSKLRIYSVVEYNELHAYYVRLLGRRTLREEDYKTS
ncbi:hypothetical protein COCOBI_pt-1990 (chloroplast) [Coccomyxa sp. Obi]|nr:hypothetical protein COCOBI_pt-1990 [Coccomyxa sp. Obi]